MRIRPATRGDLGRLGAYIGAQQTDARTHIGYLVTAADAIARDLAGLEPLGPAGILLAEANGEVVGALAAEWDDEPPRVWWHGPFVDSDGWDSVADLLFAAGLALLPASVTEHELAPDDRNTRVAAFARRHGFTPGEASAALRLDGSGVGGDPHRPAPSPPGQTTANALPVRPRTGDPAASAHAGPGAGGVKVGPLRNEDRDAVAALHNRLFAGTHLGGSRLDEGERRVLVAQAATVVGYVAVEAQSDGDGYIDFLGVAEEARGAGVGEMLVRAACAELRDSRGCGSVHLTVRESLSSARRLYERCGFVQERLLRPWRRGFA